jgi:hypothetical protein
MNTDQFNILPNYITKKLGSSIETKEVNVKKKDEVDTTVSNDEWIIYFDGKHNYEYQNKRFWSKPTFVIRPLLKKVHFKKLFIKLLIPEVQNNRLIIKSNDEILYTTDIVNTDVEIILDHREEYIFECLSFYPLDKTDKRILGSYISDIKMTDNDNFLHLISYKDMILFDTRHIKPFIQ